MNLAQENKVVALHRVEGFAVGLLDNDLWIAESFGLLIVLNPDHPSLGIKQVNLPLRNVISVNINNITHIKFQVIFGIPFYQIDRLGLMIQPIMAQTLIELGNQYIVAFKILQMRESDIKWQCIRLVAFVVEDVKELVVLDDHDAAVLGKLVQPEGSCQVAHLFNSVLVDQGEGMLVFLDDEDFIGH